MNIHFFFILVRNGLVLSSFKVTLMNKRKEKEEEIPALSKFKMKSNQNTTQRVREVTVTSIYIYREP